MRVTGIFVTVILYVAIVFSAVVFLVAVQLRSEGGENFDLWRLNCNENRRLLGEQEKALTSRQQEQGQNNEQRLFVETCLRLFDGKGILRSELIDAETARNARKAAVDRTPLDRLTGPVYCLVRGYPNLQFDQSMDDMHDKGYSLQIDGLQKSLDSTQQQYAELIKGREDFVALASLANVWYEKPLLVCPYDLVVLLLV
jgi:hypothetical protein